jgi:head-tail adaptor
MRPINPTRRLVLEGVQRTPDGMGGFVETWAPRGTLWADIRPGVGREVADAFLARPEVALRIHVRGAPVGAPSRPVAGERFREGDRVYAIRAVTEADPRGAWLVCFCVEEEGA